MDTRFKNTDFFIEDIDESVKDLTVNDSSVSHFPANTDFFIENIDNNVIEICTDRGITPSTVSVVPANTDFFIVNIDTNVKKIATDLSITPSSVSKSPANTDFFIENIYFNLILICEELNIEPYEITVTPTNTDFFIETIAKNVEKIMEAQTEIHVSGTFIHAVLSADSEISEYELDGNATQDGTPTPDAPQPINTVTGEQTVNVVGKNLFSGFATLASNSTFVDGTLTMATSATNTSSDFAVQGSTAYYLNFDTPNQTRIYIREYDASGTMLVNTTKYVPYGFTTNADTKIVRIYFAPSTSETFPVTVKDIQLEFGSTATAYEPYQGQEYEVNLGKNLFYISQDTIITNAYLNNNTTLTFDNLNSVKFVATGTQGAQYLYRIISGLDKTRTYIFSFKAIKNVKGSTGLPYIRIVSYGSNDGSTWTNLGVSGENNPTEGETYLFAKTLTGYSQYRFMIFNNVDTPVEIGETTTFFDMQLEVGEQTSFTPYFTPIELAKIGTYQDRIYKDDGKWYIEKQVGKIIKDVSIMGIGSDGTSSTSTVSAVGAFIVQKDWWNSVGGDYDNDIALARASINIGQYKSYARLNQNIHANSMDDGTFCQRTGTNDRIYFKCSNMAGKTGAELKAILQAQGGTNFYYALATPTTTEITDETLLGQLNDIYDMELKEGVVNISITATSPNLPASLKATIIAKE